MNLYLLKFWFAVLKFGFAVLNLESRECCFCLGLLFMNVYAGFFVVLGLIIYCHFPFAVCLLLDIVTCLLIPSNKMDPTCCCLMCAFFEIGLYINFLLCK